MLNKQLFKSELVKNGYTFKSMAKELGISERTFSTRVKKGDFGSDEMDKMIPLLHPPKRTTQQKLQLYYIKTK